MGWGRVGQLKEFQTPYCHGRAVRSQDGPWLSFLLPRQIGADGKHSQAPIASNRDREWSGMSSPSKFSSCQAFCRKRRDIATPGCRIVRSSAQTGKKLWFFFFSKEGNSSSLDIWKGCGEEEDREEGWAEVNPVRTGLGKMSMEHGGRRSLYRKLAHLLDSFRHCSTWLHMQINHDLSALGWFTLPHKGRPYGQPALRCLLEVIRKHIL